MTVPHAPRPLDPRRTFDARTARASGARPAWQALLRFFLVLIAVRGATNFLRPFGYGTGFVFFGKLLTGTTGAAVAIAVGTFMLVYVWGAWRLRHWSLPMAVAYALFVALNIPLFAVLNEVPATAGYAAFGLAFLAVGVGVTAGAAWLLWRHRGELT